MSEYKKWERPPKIKTEGVITTCIAVPSRYIDAEWLKQNFNTVFWSQITKTIDSAPSIDIVRCVECEWSKPNKYGDLDCTCHVPTFRTIPQGYCWRGQRSSK
jgi:hypothetical protein